MLPVNNLKKSLAISTKPIHKNYMESCLKHVTYV